MEKNYTPFVSQMAMPICKPSSIRSYNIIYTCNRVHLTLDVQSLETFYLLFAEIFHFVNFNILVYMSKRCRSL